MAEEKQKWQTIAAMIVTDSGFETGIYPLEEREIWILAGIKKPAE